MHKRIECLRNLLSDDEAVLISGYPNIFYYSGFTSEDAYLIISHTRLVIVTDSRYTIQAKKQAPDFEIIDIKIGWEEILKSFGEKFIGYEEYHLSVRSFNALRDKATDKEFLPMQNKINSLREIKDEKEIKLISEAEKIGDEAFNYIIKRIKQGREEREIALDIEFFMKKQGATSLSFDTICASGVRSAMPHGTATGKVIENGDFLTLDFGCVFEGYCSDMTRTVVVGKADEKQKEIYNIVLSAQLAALDAILPDKKCSDIDDVARTVIAKSGYGENFGHGLGHSIGIEIHESPSFSPRCGSILAEGNVMTVEPGIYIENFGGVRIEDLIVVTKDGILNLTSSPKHLIEL